MTSPQPFASAVRAAARLALLIGLGSVLLEALVLGLGVGLAVIALAVAQRAHWVPRPADPALGELLTLGAVAALLVAGCWLFERRPRRSAVIARVDRRLELDGALLVGLDLARGKLQAPHFVASVHAALEGRLGRREVGRAALRFQPWLGLAPVLGLLLLQGSGARELLAARAAAQPERVAASGPAAAPTAAADEPRQPVDLEAGQPDAGEAGPERAALDDPEPLLSNRTPAEREELRQLEALRAEVERQLEATDREDPEAVEGRSAQPTAAEERSAGIAEVGPPDPLRALAADLDRRIAALTGDLEPADGTPDGSAASGPEASEAPTDSSTQPSDAASGVTPGPDGGRISARNGPSEPGTATWTRSGNWWPARHDAAVRAWLADRPAVDQR